MKIKGKMKSDIKVEGSREMKCERMRNVGESVNVKKKKEYDFIRKIFYLFVFN